MPIAIIVFVAVLFFMSQGTASGGTRQRDDSAPAVGTGPGSNLPKDPRDLVVYTFTHPDAVNKAIFGVSMDDFKTWDQMSAFNTLEHNMCACYHGNADACRQAKLQAPGLRTCKPGDCDCHPKKGNGSTVIYRDSRGGPYTTTYGPKVICRTQSAGKIDVTIDPYC